MWGYVLLPAIINICILLLVVFLGWYYIKLFTDWLLDVTGLSYNPEGFFKYLIIFFKWAFRITIYVLLFLFYTSVYRYIVLAILSPALALLSEKTDKLLTGHKYPFRLWQFLKDVFRGIRIVIRNFLIEMACMIVFFFLSFIPVIGWFTPVVLFLVTCYLRVLND